MKSVPLGEFSGLGGMGNFVNCMVKEEIPEGECSAETFIILVPYKLLIHC